MPLRHCCGWILADSGEEAEDRIGDHPPQSNGRAELKITAGDFARTLVANGLVLIGDCERFKVIQS
jgi:hypothetical protein